MLGVLAAIGVLPGEDIFGGEIFLKSVKSSNFENLFQKKVQLPSQTAKFKIFKSSLPFAAL